MHSNINTTTNTYGYVNNLAHWVQHWLGLQLNSKVTPFKGVELKGLYLLFLTYVPTSCTKMSKVRRNYRKTVSNRSRFEILRPIFQSYSTNIKNLVNILNLTKIATFINAFAYWFVLGCYVFNNFLFFFFLFLVITLLFYLW